jgi:hypothetical protein
LVILALQVLITNLCTDAQGVSIKINLDNRHVKLARWVSTAQKFQ